MPVLTIADPLSLSGATIWHAFKKFTIHMDVGHFKIPHSPFANLWSFEKLMYRRPRRPGIGPCHSLVDASIGDVEELNAILDRLSQNSPASEGFLVALESVNKMTSQYKFSPELFRDSNVLEILLGIGFCDGPDYDWFFKARALKVIANLLNQQIEIYAEVLFEADILAQIAPYLLNSDDKVILNALKCVAALLGYGNSCQICLDRLTMKPFLHILTLHYLKSSIYRQLLLIVHAFSACELGPHITDFLLVCAFCLDKMPPEKTFWILWTLEQLVSQETADAILNCEPIMNFLIDCSTGPTSGLIPPSLACISSLSCYCQQGIPGFDYEKLLPLTCDPRSDGSPDEVGFSALNAIANIVTSPVMCERLLELNLVSYLKIARRVGAFENFQEIAVGLSNAVLSASAEGLNVIMEQGGMELLVAALEIDNREIQLYVLRGMERLINAYAADEEACEAVRQDFSQIDMEILDALLHEEDNELFELSTMLTRFIDVERAW
jgi:hypothetical protein